MMPVTTTAPGWYQDPQGRFPQRYWDGTRWTEHVVDTHQNQAVDTTAAPAAHFHQHVMLAQPKRYGGGLIAFGWIACFLTLGYMLPWAIALTRQSDKAAGTGLVNLFLGWTVIGWIAAFIMACV
jgi:hypothetical protein